MGVYGNDMFIAFICFLGKQNQIQFDQKLFKKCTGQLGPSQKYAETKKGIGQQNYYSLQYFTSGQFQYIV